MAYSHFNPVVGPAVIAKTKAPEQVKLCLQVDRLVVVAAVIVPVTGSLGVATLHVRGDSPDATAIIVPCTTPLGEQCYLIGRAFSPGSVLEISFNLPAPAVVHSIHSSFVWPTGSPLVPFVTPLLSYRLL